MSDERMPVNEALNGLGCETDDGAYCSAHTGMLSACLLRALVTEQAARREAEEARDEVKGLLAVQNASVNRLRQNVADLGAEVTRLAGAVEAGKRVAESLAHCRNCRDCGDGPCCDECGSQAALDAFAAALRPADATEGR